MRRGWRIMTRHNSRKARKTSTDTISQLPQRTTNQFQIDDKFQQPIRFFAWKNLSKRRTMAAVKLVDKAVKLSLQRA